MFLHFGSKDEIDSYPQNIGNRFNLDTRIYVWKFIFEVN